MINDMGMFELYDLVITSSTCL